MKPLTLNERFDNLDRIIMNDKLIRRGWGSVRSGCTCLVGAISPEAVINHSVAYVPPEVIPAWWARVSVSIDDNGSTAKWSEITKRWAKITRIAATTLTGAQWDDAEKLCKQKLFDYVTSLAPSGSRWIELQSETLQYIQRAQGFAVLYIACLDTEGVEANSRPDGMTIFEATEASWDRMSDLLLSAIESVIDNASNKDDSNAR